MGGRLRRCLERLDGYPRWDAELRGEPQEFVDRLTENQCNGRLGGKELEAALSDPRWQAKI